MFGAFSQIPMRIEFGILILIDSKVRKVNQLKKYIYFNLLSSGKYAEITICLSNFKNFISGDYYS